MKSLLYVFAISVLWLGLLLSVALGGQAVQVDQQAQRVNIDQEQEQHEQQAARIEFEATTHNFGDISPGSKNLCEFKFRNAGDALLKIKNVSKTCGCTPFTLEKKEYAPGEEGVLKVRYNASGRGPVSRRLYMYSNDAKKPKVQLTVKANIIQKVKYQPKSLDFSLEGPGAGTAELTLRSIDEKPFSIASFSATADAISYIMGDSIMGASGSTVLSEGRPGSADDTIAAPVDPNTKDKVHVLKLEVDPNKALKLSRGRIQIRLTHPECKSIVVPFTVLPKFKVDPPSINVLNAKPGESEKKEVWILSNYDKDFEIESISSKKGLIKVESREKVGKRYKLVLEIAPPQTNSKNRVFSDTLVVNIKGGGQLDVSCRGFYAKQ